MTMEENPRILSSPDTERANSWNLNGGGRRWNPHEVDSQPDQDGGAASKDIEIAQITSL